MSLQYRDKSLVFWKPRAKDLKITSTTAWRAKHSPSAGLHGKLRTGLTHSA